MALKNPIKQEARRIKKLERSRNERANPQAYPRYMLRHARSRAKLRGIECTITLDDIAIPEKCPVLGIILTYGNRRGQASSPSLDRKNPSKGYIPGNVQVISSRANKLKLDCFDPSELRAVADYIEGVAQ